jgi:hypothetical protein
MAEVVKNEKIKPMAEPDYQIQGTNVRMLKQAYANTFSSARQTLACDFAENDKGCRFFEKTLVLLVRRRQLLTANRKRPG